MPPLPIPDPPLADDVLLGTIAVQRRVPVHRTAMKGRRWTPAVHSRIAEDLA